MSKPKQFWLFDSEAGVSYKVIDLRDVTVNESTPTIDSTSPKSRIPPIRK